MTNEQTILIVDDEQLNRKLLRAHLSNNGYTVWEAAGGIEALEKAKEKPDLILLDVMMPTMDGFEVCRLLKESRPLGAYLSYTCLRSTILKAKFMGWPSEELTLLKKARRKGPALGST